MPQQPTYLLRISKFRFQRLDQEPKPPKSLDTENASYCSKAISLSMKKSMAIPIDDDFPLDGNNWEDLDDNEQCIVCFEHLPDTVFIECGHR